MINLPYIATESAVTVYTNDSGPLTVSKVNHPSAYETAREALSAGDEEALMRALSPAKAIIHAFETVQGHTVEIKDNQLLLDGQPLSTYTANKALEFAAQNIDVKPLMRFIARCANNPSFRAVKELYGFLEYGSMPLTPDGCFLAYKRVRDNYRDVYSNTVDNNVGAVVSMPRNQVDDNSENTCSYGLHFCSFEYLSHFSGSRIMVLKIDPADVVSIPQDYNNTKGRCAKYTVVGEQELPERWKSPVIYDYDEDYEDEDEDEYLLQGTVYVTTYGHVSVLIPGHSTAIDAGHVSSPEGIADELFFSTPHAEGDQCRDFAEELVSDWRHGNQLVRDFYI